MNKKYAVVLWSDEPNNYSYVKISRIRYDSSKITCEEHFLNQIFEIQVDKSTPETCAAKVLHVGSRAKMSKMATDLAHEAAENSILVEEDLLDTARSPGLKNKRHLAEAAERKTKKKARIDYSQNLQQPESTPSTSDAVSLHQSPCNEIQLHRLDPDSPEDNEGGLNRSIEDVEELREDAIVEKDKMIEELRSKLRKKERRISKLKRDLAQFQPEESDAIDIGEGFMVSGQIIQELKADFRHNPGVFLRKLMERSKLFSLEEIAASSVTGQKHRDGTQRPRLNVQRFGVCKEFTIKKCKLEDNTTRMLQFSKSIANICTDARKRLSCKRKA